MRVGCAACDRSPGLLDAVRKHHRTVPGRARMMEPRFRTVFNYPASLAVPPPTLSSCCKFCLHMREWNMKLARWIAVAAAIAAALPADAATTDPIMLIYRASGAISNTPQNLVTTVYCSSFSAVNENIEFVARDPNSSLVLDSTQTVSPFTTFSTSLQSLGASNLLASAISLLVRPRRRSVALRTSISMTAMATCRCTCRGTIPLRTRWNEAVPRPDAEREGRLVPRTRSSHYNCRGSGCELRVQSGIQPVALATFASPPSRGLFAAGGAE
jgi:hypothetical protein